MVSHPETGSDSPIGSDRDRGRDTYYPEKHEHPTVLKFVWVIDFMKRIKG